jgi:hypothetical protein
MAVEEDKPKYEYAQVVSSISIPEDTNRCYLPVKSKKGRTYYRKYNRSLKSAKAITLTELIALNVKRAQEFHDEILSIDLFTDYMKGIESNIFSASPLWLKLTEQKEVYARREE